MRRFFEKKFLKQKFINHQNYNMLVEQYSKLISCFAKYNVPKVEYFSINDIFEVTYKIIVEVGSQFPIKILGNSGTGKSTFLSLLFIYLYNKLSENNYKYIPVYLDLHYYLKLESSNAAQSFEQDFKIITEVSKKYINSFIVVIVDSIEVTCLLLFTTIIAI